MFVRDLAALSSYVLGALGSIPGVRANLLLAVRLRSTADIHRLEAALVDRVPGLELLDVTLALRHVKRMGRLLDDRGRAIEAVPLGLE